MDERKRYEGTFFAYQSSYNAKAIFKVSCSRVNRNGKRENLWIEIEIARSSIGCIVHGLKQFAEKEREAIGGLPL
jgi:hypothetical protein